MIYARLLSQMFRAKCIAVENKDRCENTQKKSRFSRSDRSVESTWDVTHAVDRIFETKNGSTLSEKQLGHHTTENRHA